MATLIKVEKTKVVESGFTVGEETLSERKKVKGEWTETGDKVTKFRVGFVQSNGFFRGLSLNPDQLTPEIAKACVKEFNKYVNPK